MFPTKGRHAGPSKPRRDTPFSSACKHRTRLPTAGCCFTGRGEQYIPQAIRDALPYFLGAVDEDQFFALKRYQDVRARLRRLEREYTETQAITRSASNVALSLLADARRAGLVAPDAQPEDASSVLALLWDATAPQPDRLFDYR